MNLWALLSSSANGLPSGVAEGESAELLTHPCIAVSTPCPVETSQVGRRGTACCVVHRRSCKSCGRAHTAGCPCQCGSPRGTLSHRSSLWKKEKWILTVSLTCGSHICSVQGRRHCMQRERRSQRVIDISKDEVRMDSPWWAEWEVWAGGYGNWGLLGTSALVFYHGYNTDHQLCGFITESFYVTMITARNLNGCTELHPF